MELVIMTRKVSLATIYDTFGDGIQEKWCVLGQLGIAPIFNQEFADHDVEVRVK